MRSAQLILWEIAGKPPVAGAKGKLLQEHPAQCCITGEWSEITADAKKALGENFTDHSLWNNYSGRVAPWALWCCSGAGRTSPRMWTWVATPGRPLPPSHEKAYVDGVDICLTNRANTRPVIDTLLDPPAGEWAVSIGVSGQKHHLPYAKSNMGGAWTIRMEGTNVTATSADFREVFNACLALRRLGINDINIKNGTSGFLKTPEDVHTWTVMRTRLEPYQASPITDLALWCITKPIMEDIHGYPNS